MASQPWHELPSEIADVLRPELDDVADEIIVAVGEVPAYARPLEGPFGRGVRAGVHEALRNFVDEIAAGEPVARADVYGTLGRGEMRAGRSLDALLSAYRAGARVAWRRFSAVGVEAGLAPETLYHLAESIFAYIDVLSAESAEGHAREQSAAAGEEQLRSRRVVRMLVGEAPAEPSEVQAAAREAGWRLPAELAVLAIAGEGRTVAALGLPPDAIGESVGEISIVLIPDPGAPGRLAAVRHALAAAHVEAGLGPSVPWTDTPLSFARSRAALALAQSDGQPSLVNAQERAGELLLRSDPELARELAEPRLAPLSGLPQGSRRRLTETLRVWLAEQGRLVRVAQRLDIHPQTARYRVARLRDLFGTALDDADARFWIEMALRIDAGTPSTGSTPLTVVPRPGAD